ncbi:UDP-glucose 4-epimerase [Thozetella sp. PMI_491]|nr:UDP-glucose 4-epimerase [Thozetella sp. PMI_491]
MIESDEALSSSSSVPSSEPASPSWSPITPIDGFECNSSVYGVSCQKSTEDFALPAPRDGDKSFTLVIGGMGYIGSHTVLELLREGYNVIVVDNLSNSHEDVLREIQQIIFRDYKDRPALLPVIHFHHLDYRSRSMDKLIESYSYLSESTGPDGGRSLKYRSKITSVIHFAAFKSVAESIHKPLQYYQNNVCGLVSLLELLDKHNIHQFIFSSSATIYGTKAASGTQIHEDDVIHHAKIVFNDTGNAVKLQPSVVGLSCPYARTKYFAEAILADVAASNPAWKIVALRYFNPVGCDPSGRIGENPRMEPTNLYPVLTQVLTGSREKLEIFGSDWDTRDGTAVRDFIHVLDVARGHTAALAWNHRRSDPKDGGDETPGLDTFNLGTGTGTTVLEAVRSLEMAAGAEIPLQWADRRVGDVGSCVASNQRAMRELGWFPREGVEQCAADLWNYVQRVHLAEEAKQV